jgi:hypothetical protein
MRGAPNATNASRPLVASGSGQPPKAWARKILCGICYDKAKRLSLGDDA